MRVCVMGSRVHCADCALLFMPRCVVCAVRSVRV